MRSCSARGLALGLVAAAAVLAGTGLRAQDGARPYPIYTADHLAGTMETLGPTSPRRSRARAGGRPRRGEGAACPRREQLATTITFWRQHERDDAVGFIRTAVRAMDDLDAAMSVDAVDAEAASGLAAEVQARCAACHENLSRSGPGGRLPPQDRRARSVA